MGQQIYRTFMPLDRKAVQWNFHILSSVCLAVLKIPSKKSTESCDNVWTAMS